MADLPHLSRRSLTLLLLLGLMSTGLWFGIREQPPVFKEASTPDVTPPLKLDTVSAPNPITASRLGAPAATTAQERRSLSKVQEEEIKALKSAGEDLRAGRPFTLKERGQVGRFRLALNEMYDGSAPVHKRLRKIPEQPDAIRLLNYAENEAQRLGKWPGLVIYPEKGPVDTAHRRVLTEQVLLKSQDVIAAENLAETVGLTVTNRPAYAPQHLVTAAADPLAAVDAMAELKGHTALETIEPLLMRQASSQALLDDPYLQDQWHVKNTGQVGGSVRVDIGVESVWDEYQGEGIRIAIVDDGLQGSHPDLIANVDSENGYDWNDADNDPSPDTHYDFHGTAVGGLVAARGNNQLGVSGVAPQATLVGFRLIAGLVTDESEAESAIRGADIIQIKNNSWGLIGPPSELGFTGELMAEAMATAATSGRGGLGTISLWAAGNSRKSGLQSNKDAYSNSIYGITVGAVSSQGKLTSYSETGSHICVVAPSNESTQGIVTTDLVGVAGYNQGGVKNLAEVDYTNNFGGTSAATPIVSGVVALMLQANPNLSWRDVKEILLRSSTKLAPKDKGWVERPNRDDWEIDRDLPPIKHHHSYGGGLVNAAAAVAIAKTWPGLGPMQSEVLTQTPEQTVEGLHIAASGGTPIIILPEESKAKTKSTRVDVDFSNTTALRVENVTVTFNAAHARKGDLTIKLISPSGTISVLASASSLDTGTNYSDWTFSSMRHWGESSRGIWSVVASEKQDDMDGELGSITITLHGTSYPAIQLTNRPDIQIVAEGSNSSFFGATTQFGKTTQQWLKNGKPIAGATSGSLNFTPAKLTDGAFYTYTANNLTGSMNVLTALGVVRQVIPSQQVLPGRTATFKVFAAGPELRYQWFAGSTPLRDDDHIRGSRSATLTLRKVSSDDAQDYYCRVSLGDAAPLNTSFATLSIMIPPDWEPFTAPDTGIVSGFVEIPLLTNNDASTYRAKGLPPGLKLNAKTGVITGRPTKAGSYEVTLIASNAAGSSPPFTFIWEVEDLPPGTPGTYRGLVQRSTLYNDNYGGTLTLTLSKTGSFTGSLTRGKTRTPIKGYLDTYAGETYSTANVSVPRPGSTDPLYLTFTLENGRLDGSIGLEEDDEFALLTAFQQWTALPPDFNSLPGLYNLPLTPGVTSSIYPLGTGFLSATLNTKGRMSYAGRLADGTSLTGSSMPCGENLLPLHHMLYGNTGSVQGDLTINSLPPGLDIALEWFKSPKPNTRSYSNGFPIHSLTGTGLKYTPPLANALVLNLPLTSFNARLDFSEGGLFIPFTQYFTVAAKNVPSFPLGSGNPHQLKLTINVKTGLITGRGTAMDIDPAHPELMRQRPGTYAGLIIPGLNRAEGYFLLPENTSPTSPIRSGHMTLREDDD